MKYARQLQVIFERSQYIHMGTLHPIELPSTKTDKQLYSIVSVVQYTTSQGKYTALPFIIASLQVASPFLYISV
jgi:hypothetical protein